VDSKNDKILGEDLEEVNNMRVTVLTVGAACMRIGEMRELRFSASSAFEIDP
jgi:hypothetical protein